MEIFYRDVENKRKGIKTRLQVDLEFIQGIIFDLNKKYNTDMVSTAVRDRKVFAAEEKIKELKKIIFRLKLLEKKSKKVYIKTYEIVKKSTDYMNSLPSRKYGVSPNQIEKKYLESERYREQFNIRRIRISFGEIRRQEKYQKKIYRRKKLKLRVPLDVGEEVLILLARLKKKDSPGNFYKSSAKNRLYFNKDKIFQITNRENIDGKNFYLVKNTKTETIGKKRKKETEVNNKALRLKKQ